MKKNLFLLTIIFIIIVSTLSVSWVVYSFYLLATGHENAIGTFTNASVYLFFLRLTGTLTFICIGIAASLGALRNFIFSFYRNTDFWKIHTRWASSLGIGFGISHLLVFLLYQYRLDIPISLKLFAPNFARFTTSSSNLIFLSTTALCIFTMNVIISNIPVLKAKWWWKPLHILNYFGFFLVLTHAFFLGGDSYTLIFRTMYAIFLVLVLSGSFVRFRAFRSKKQVETPVAPSDMTQRTP